MSNAYLYRMPSGIPGMDSRPSNSTIETQAMNPSTPFSAYGMFGKIVAGLFVPLVASDVLASVYGILVRPFPTVSGTDALGVSTPPQTAAQGMLGNVMKRGYMTVLLGAGTAAAGGQVYVRTTVGSSGRPIGDISSVPSDPSNVLAVNAYFMSGADAAGNVEIAYNI